MRRRGATWATGRVAVDLSTRRAPKDFTAYAADAAARGAWRTDEDAPGSRPAGAG
ncbi:hypothetical protein GA0070610_3667 [Micromonospora echinofusca]|uniref:Uncharacterized protein n=1 Tax=Micromonospora echinofusca TaxID=47858 RepID=A0A1C5GDZ4_MICEH|nr:hypothetical protein GA0070610_3667 [Micromonospora echinofusca]